MDHAAHISAEGLSTAPLTSPADFKARGADTDLLVLPDEDGSPYIIGFALSQRCIEQALRLRYSIFNEELGGGLLASRKTGLDRDAFDDQMDHLVLIKKTTGQIIGTYRLQTVRDAMKGLGTYSAPGFEISPLEPFFPQLLETGRACITREYRNFFTIMHLWKGVGAYMNIHRCRYLFGCCSITSLDPDDGWRAMKALRERNAFHPDILIHPTPDFSCGDPSRENDPDIKAGFRIPKLFRVYLTLGAKVVSYPAVDRGFGTIIYLVLLDSKAVSFSSLAKLT